MFAGSSRNNQVQNPDGTWNSYCYSCQRFIAKTILRAPRALCYICQSAEEGRPLSAEAIQTYEASKLDRADIGVLNLTEPPSPMPGKQKKVSFANIAGPVFRALGRFGLATQGDQGKQSQQPSAQIARAKRRSRLFSKGELTEDNK